MTTNGSETLVRAWTIAQENTRHFNEILMRIRGGAVLVIAAAIASAATLPEFGHLVIAGISGGAFVVFVGLYVIDRWYYHILLLATVGWARALEQKMFKGVGLAQHVSDEFARVSLINRTKNVTDLRAQERRRTAGDRVAIFYGLLMIPSLTLSLIHFQYWLNASLGWKIMIPVLGAVLTIASLATIEWRGHHPKVLARVPRVLLK